MSQYLLLDTLNMTEHFFENAQLFGIGSTYKPIQITHHLNELFRLDLKREFEFDWKKNLPSSSSSKSLKIKPSLFDEPSDNMDIAQETIFPVYYYNPFLSDIEYYLYSNQINQQQYIKSQKDIQYFFLIKNGQYLPFLQNITSYIKLLPQVFFCKKYDISQCSWKEYLII